MMTTLPVTDLLERLARLIHNELHAEGLKPTQWEALRYLSRANRFSRSPGALTAYLGMTKGTVSQTVTALARKGLLSKQGARGDRRAVHLALTAEGQALLERDPMQRLRQDLERASADLPASLADDLGALIRRLIQARDGKGFGACRTCRHFRASDPKGAPSWCGLLNEPLTPEDSQLICVEQELASA